MEFKGTKGEWVLSKRQTEYGVRFYCKQPNLDVWSLTGVTVSECEANAKLIAAAPDLLEALQELMKAYKGLLNCVDIMADSADDYVLAEQAINKALS